MGRVLYLILRGGESYYMPLWALLGGGGGGGGEKPKEGSRPGGGGHCLFKVDT